MAATNRKTTRIGIITSARRAQKLRQYAERAEKSVTQLIEEFIDRLPVVEVSEAKYYKTL